MKKSLLILCLLLGTLTMNAVPTITIDGDKSDWAEVPMLSEPGMWPMLKVIPSADAELGTNALAFMMENKEAFTSDWSKYPGTYIDKDYDKSTNPASSWVYEDMGIDYSFTTGADPGSGWMDFPKGKSADYKVIELGVPASYLTDLGPKFGIGMYYGTGGSQEWFLPKRAGDDIDKKIGFLYKTRPFAILPCTVTASNAFVHNCMGDCTDYVDFGLRDNGNDTARWAAFPIELTKPGLYSFTTNVTSTNGWKFEFWVVDVASNAVVAHLDAPESNISSSKSSYTFGPIDLTSVPAGKYMLKVKNKTRYSTVKLNNIVVAYEGGAIGAVPGYLLGEDALLEKVKVYHDANGYIHYNDNGTPTNEYAYWKIHASAAYSGKVLLDIPTESTGQGHEFHVELYSALDGEKLSEAIETSSTKWNIGLIELPETFTISAAGDYFIKLVNHTQWSHAILRSISMAPAVTIDEAETNSATVIGTNNGKAFNATLTRTLTAGRYNTICLPFAVNASEMARVFPGAKVKELTSSSIEEDGFVLNLNFNDATTLAAGTPYLIQPATTVENPKFLGVTIDETLRPSETTNADFIGNFVKAEVPAGDDNFFLGTDNKLYYSNDATPIKGLRAYIAVKGGAGAPKRARMVMDGENITTDIELVGDSETAPVNSNVRKVITNGQLIVIKDGAQYNTLGIRVK